MNKDRIKGKAKDIAGRVQRQTGEWTGDTEGQVKGAAKQAEGKVQNTWGKLKDQGREMREREEARRDRPTDGGVAEDDRDLDEEIAPEESPRRPKRAA
jgi:uncharacterized protein YjbJ (UPF0337 family)